MTIVRLPKMDLSMEEGTISSLLVKLGMNCKKGDVILEIETDKTLAEVEMPEDGTIEEMFVKVGEVVPVGAPLIKFASADSSKQIPETEDGIKEDKAAISPLVVVEVSNVTNVNANRKDRRLIAISPSARRRARELQVDYEDLQGSGPNGRIIHCDIEAAWKRAEQHGDTATIVTQRTVGGGSQRIELTRMRRTIAKRMVASVTTIPQFYLKRKVDITKLLEIKKTMEKSILRSRNVKISLNDFFMKAVADALRAVPQLNASFIDSSDQVDSHILQHEDVNVGMAVSTPTGLLVPVFHQADQLSVTEIGSVREKRVNAIRDGKETIEQLQGGTFTITNLGAMDIEEFTAIVNPPESGILAIGTAIDEIKLMDGQFVARPMVTLVGSFDHRTVDGVLAAQFMKAVVEQLQSEEWLLF
jgi:pyruvate dehydrogenase E2 component (dihydrolipoamide acetyltransferase)